MFSAAFDWILVAIFAFCGVALLIGKGDFILTAFQNKNDKGKPSTYDMKKLSFVTGILCMIMLAAELVFIFCAETMPILIWVALVVVILSFVVSILYLRKYAMNDGKKK